MAATPHKYVFKLRFPVTGKFSAGGASPRADKRGKMWTNLGHIKTHLQQGARYPANMEIVTFDLVDVSKITLASLRAEQEAEHQRKEAKRLEIKHQAEKRATKQRDENERRELARLKALYEPTPHS